MAKLSKKLQTIVHNIVKDTIPALASNLVRIQAGDESLPEWISSCKEDYYKGMLQAEYRTVETILMAHNCYSGFKFSCVECKGHKVEYHAYYLNLAFEGR